MSLPINQHKIRTLCFLAFLGAQNPQASQTNNYVMLLSIYNLHHYIENIEAVVADECRFSLPPH